MTTTRAKGFTPAVLLKGEFLRYAVVSEDEVVGGECEDEITGLIADECGRKNKSRASAEQRGLWGLLGNGLGGFQRPLGRC